jgi:hypothetical protein
MCTIINAHLDKTIESRILRATLDEGPSSKVQRNRAILLAESQKLDLWPLDDGQRPKSDKSRL